MESLLQLLHATYALCASNDRYIQMVLYRRRCASLEKSLAVLKSARDATSSVLQAVYSGAYLVRLVISRELTSGSRTQPSAERNAYGYPTVRRSRRRRSSRSPHSAVNED